MTVLSRLQVCRSRWSALSPPSSPPSDVSPETLGSSLTFSMAQQRRPGYSSVFPWAPGLLLLLNLADRS